jgi:hypothetical protein
MITQFHQRHRSGEFRQFLDTIDAAVSAAVDAHVKPRITESFP